MNQNGSTTQCECGHGLLTHTFGPGRPVSCGKVHCECVSWRPVTVHNVRKEENALSNCGGSGRIDRLPGQEVA
jgi:hypothetical protein